MAVYRLIIKTSPDLSFPLEPHPVLNPAVYLQAPVPNPPLTPRLRPEDIPPPDLWINYKPHPVYNVATWEQNRLAVPPTIPKQRPERSPMAEYPFPIEPHPSLNVATWEAVVKPAMRALQRIPPMSDLYITPTVVVATPDYGWTPPIAPATVKRFRYEEALRGVANFPVTVTADQWLSERQPQPFVSARLNRITPPESPVITAANPSLAWARWNSDPGPRRPIISPRRLTALTDQPFITSTPRLTPDRWQAMELPRRFKQTPLRHPVDWAVWSARTPTAGANYPLFKTTGLGKDLFKKL